MRAYATDTSVSVEKSRAEIESILSRHGATAFAYATNAGKAMIKFEANGRHVMFILELPDRDATKYTHFRGNRHGRKLPLDKALDNWEHDCRRIWRSLALLIKAKMVGIADGIVAFESEFLANIVMPDGQTVSQIVTPLIESAYQTKKMPAMLPHFGGSK